MSYHTVQRFVWNFLGLLGIIHPVEAATVVSLTATWPTEGVRTVDALNNTPAFRGINGSRINRQSFAVPSNLSVSSIYFSATGQNSNLQRRAVYRAV